jgi:hypothetical protein
VRPNRAGLRPILISPRRQVADAATPIFPIVPDPEDIVEIGGVRRSAAGQPPRRGRESCGPRRRFLSVWYRCCHTYGRLNRNRDGTAYEGSCPRCGARVQALIGPGGTDRRCFEAR